MSRKRTRDEIDAGSGSTLFRSDLAALQLIFGETDHVVKDLRIGDSESMVFFKLAKPASKRHLILHLLVPSLDAYGSSHSTSVWAEDDDLPPETSAALDAISDHVNLSLRQVLRLVVAAVHGEEGVAAFDKVVASSPKSTEKLTKRVSMVIDDDESDTEDAWDHDVDDTFGIGSLGNDQGRSKELTKVLQSRFKAILKAGYKPGFRQLSDGSQVITVSAKLAQLGIPATALNAWDRKLLKPGQRIVLMMSFAHGIPLEKEGLDQSCKADIEFLVGLSMRSKPSKAAITNAFRIHSSISKWTPGEFESFSLADSLSNIMREHFRNLLAYREANPNRGWAAGEAASIGHFSLPRETSITGGIDKAFAKKLDKEEKATTEDIALPQDPMKSGGKSNFPLLAMAYLIRRFALSPRYCLVCNRHIEHVAIRPFCCLDDLCRFQYLNLGLGPSLEYEILTNSSAVDLLVSLAYVSAAEGQMQEHPPKGMQIMVPGTNTPLDQIEPASAKNAHIASLIQQIPSVKDMKIWLEGSDLDLHEHTTKAKARKLTDIKNGEISVSVWNILRWIAASNTSYIREIDDNAELVRNIPASYRQFIFLSGAPEKEQAMANHIKTHAENAAQYPTLIAWHGSATRNFHAILREGLHFKTTINGRAYGNGIYFALDGSYSLGHYAQPTATKWVNADTAMGKIAALCEIVNAPSKFISSKPHFVVDKIEWVQTRYLLVQRTDSTDETLIPVGKGSMLQMDPRFNIALNNNTISVPVIVRKLLSSNNGDDTDSDIADSDLEILRAEASQIIIDSSDDEELQKTRKARAATLQQQREQFEPSATSLLQYTRTLPAPTTASPRAVLALQKEVKAIVASQAASSPAELGFYYEPGDNIFHWLVEMVAFDPTLPLAEDMLSKHVKCLLFELLFPGDFPFAPPFVRLVYPRLLPFLQGGGGNVIFYQLDAYLSKFPKVTAGGSICQDLLTASGWMSSYSVESILLQIRMGITDTERPARLDPRQWNSAYSVQEAIEAFKRAASAHGWTIPASMELTAHGQI